jgi:hypothetical protein
MAPQRLEKIESAPGNGMVSEALNPQHVVQGRAADRARLRLMSRESDEAKFSASQALEIAQAAKESRSRRRGSPRPVLTRRGRVLCGPVDEALEVSRSGARPNPESGVKSKGNFPPRKALKSLEIGKESRRRL